MPDSKPDDPFADLFGKLSDARSREHASGDAARTATPTPSQEPTAMSTQGPPLSRRAAREAAARRATTGATPIAPSSADAADPEASTPDAAAPARPAPDAVASGPATHDAPTSTAAVPSPSEWAPTSPDASPTPVRAPRQTQPLDAVKTDAAEDPWIFTGGDAALPYSRTTGTATVAANAPAVAGASRHTASRHGDSSRPSGRAATATLDDLFTGASSTDELGDVPPPKDKRRRRIGGWIALGIVLLFLGGIAVGTWYVWTTYEDNIREVMGWEEPKDYEEGLANGEVFVTIASGDTGMPISESLYDAEVTKTPEAFYDYLIKSGQNPPFQPGVYKLQKTMTSEAALAALMDPANKMELTAQIPEGFTVDGTLEQLAAGTGIPLEEFQAAAADPAAYGVPADSLEGWLFPATYTFDPGVTAQSAIQTLVDRTIESLDAAGVPVEDRQRILTIASIIQREARSEEDMQRVSTVIQNRLDPSNQETHGLLQMDSTAQYGVGEDDGTVSSSENALTDDNPWNTYVHAGLPIGPVSNPGDVAIDAAMHPADGPWLYFVTVNLDTGETVFTSTLAEHERARQQWIQWCRDNPDSGC
jgi:UPF0755 protein